MLFRLLLLGVLLGLIARFIGRIFSLIFIRPSVRQDRSKSAKKPFDIDDSQIQDADFKDL